jgi:hypothetical protein
MNTVVLKRMEPLQLSTLAKNILRVILYFDIFRHPLTSREIFHCCSEPELSILMIEEELDALLRNQLIVKQAGFYFAGNGSAVLQRRISGEENAKRWMKIAHRFSKLISHFPFVRAVMISGSLSKGYMDRTSDIDYFIITKTKRLWLSRSLLVLFKKIFLLNSRKYFCINYFVDEESLRIPDKNFFTATELIFILPTYNYELYSQLMNRNSWVRKYYPNFPLRDEHEVRPVNDSFLKRSLEKIFNGSIGEALDTFFFRLTLRHWKKKFLHFDASTFDLRLRSRKNVSKHHPNGYQEKVLHNWSERIDAFEIKYGVELR